MLVKISAWWAASKTILLLAKVKEVCWYALLLAHTQTQTTVDAGKIKSTHIADIGKITSRLQIQKDGAVIVKVEVLSFLSRLFFLASHYGRN